MAMSSEDMIRFVDDLYAASAAGDWAAIEAMLTDDFVAYEADGLPMAGEYRGKGGLLELYTKVFGLVDVGGLDLLQTTAGGDHAVTILSIRYADPALAPSELCEMFRFRDGLICEIKPFYYDPQTFHAAHRAKLALAQAPA